jgi:hypothetical protein
LSIADHSFGSSENLSSSLSRSPHRAGPEHFWARTAQGPARRPVRVVWPCLDEHPPDCLPPRTERVPPTRRRLLRTACRRQGRKSQFHCDEQVLTVAEVFSLTAGSVCARTPTSFAATPTNEHPRCSMPDPPANIGKRPILQKHSEQTSANQIPGTGHLSRHRGYCAASVTTKMFTLPCKRPCHFLASKATEHDLYRSHCLWLKMCGRHERRLRTDSGSSVLCAQCRRRSYAPTRTRRVGAPADPLPHRRY